jgi:hypothetical protein
MISAMLNSSFKKAGDVWTCIDSQSTVASVVLGSIPGGQTVPHVITRTALSAYVSSRGACLLSNIAYAMILS